MLDYVTALPWWKTALWGAAGLVAAWILFRLAWRWFRRRSEHRSRADHVAVRLREVFREVSPRRGLGAPAIDFKDKGRACRLVLHSARKLSVEMEIQPDVPLPVVIRSRKWLKIWPVLHGLEALERVVLADAVVDDQVELYANGMFAAFIQDRVMEQVPLDGPPTGLGESLLVLSATPGVRSYEVRFEPGGRDRLHLKLRTEDLLYRPEDLESLLHHVANLHATFAKFGRPEMPPAPNEAPPPEKKTDGKADGDPKGS